MTKKKSARFNWAENYRYRAEEFYQPQDIEQIQKIVRASSKIKALGSRHCFNDIADSSGRQISLENFAGEISIDEAAMNVTLDTNLRYGEVCLALDKRGFALHNLASLPHISIAGACATATHGSGIKNGNLATAVSGLEIVNGKGETVILTEKNDREILNGATVNLGALGIVTKITLKIQKTFDVRQDVFQNLSFDALAENFDYIMASGYSVSLFTDWRDSFINQVWLKRRVENDTTDLPTRFYDSVAATENLHPIAGISAENCTEQMGVGGVWCERLPHFKLGFTPSVGAELQSEYFVGKETAIEAIFALRRISEQISPLLLVSEIRAVAADNLWLSPNYKRDSIAFHFTWKQKTAQVLNLLPQIEAALAPFAARPHWGKLFTTPKEKIRELYVKLPDFICLMKQFDPEGKFVNDYLKRIFEI